MIPGNTNSNDSDITDPNITTAPWFVENNGLKEGPYTTDEILKLVNDGTLSLDNKIFDATNGTTKFAREIVPFLNLDQPPELPVSSKDVGEISLDWQPPPKPPELRDIHIVDLNEEVTAGADYFALISERKKEVEKARLKTASQQKAIASKPEIKMIPKTATVTGMKESAETQKKAAAVKLDHSDGILSAEADPSRFTKLKTNVLAFVQRNKIPISIAAGLAVVFVGSYGVLKIIAQRGAREPANQSPAEEKKKPQSAFSNPYGSPSSATSQNLNPQSPKNELGTGRNRILRPSGSVSNQVQNLANSRVIPSVEPVNNPPQDNRPPEAPANYYTPNEDNAQNEPTQYRGDVPAVNPSQSAEAASGIVDPPSYIPQEDPNNQYRDPNQNPDPNQPNPNQNAEAPPNTAPQQDNVYN